MGKRGEVSSLQHWSVKEITLVQHNTEAETSEAQSILGVVCIELITYSSASTLISTSKRSPFYRYREIMCLDINCVHTVYVLLQFLIYNTFSAALTGRNIL